MQLLTKTIIIKSLHTKQEAISILSGNLEPWHKDGSSIPFEGTIAHNGDFTLKSYYSRNAYRPVNGGLTAKGTITGTETGCEIALTFTTSSLVAVISALTVLACIALSILLFIKVIAFKTGNPWPVPIVFVLFFFISHSNTFARVIKHTADQVKTILA